MCLEQEHKPKSKNTNPKIKIQKLKISKSPFSQTQQYHQILKPYSNKSIQKCNTTNLNKKNLKLKISISSLSCLPFSIFSLFQTLRFQIKHHSLSDSVDRQWLFFFFSISQTGGGGFAHWWFFFPLFLRWVWWLGCWIGCGLLNWCGFESSMGCWISVGCWKGVGLNWSGLLNRYGLVVSVVLGCVRWLRLLWIGVGWLFRFWNFQ